MELIDKAAVVAEIERRRESNAKDRYFGRLVEDNYFLDFLNTLEVKEVDLEKEVNAYMMNEMKFLSDEVVYDTLLSIARYFFELGIKAQKL